MTRLLVVTARELTQDIRARRQVEAALELGFDVAGLSAQIAGDEPAPGLEGVPVTRVGGERISHRLRKAGLGGMRESGALVRELRGLFRLFRLGRGTWRLVRAAPAPGFDVVHANDLDSLPAGWLLARRWHALLVYDAHELYTLMEPNPPRLYRAVVSFVERTLARRARVVTNCDPYADALVGHLHLRARPTVVLNTPVLDPHEPTLGPGAEPLRAIYQAAADMPGRPLSDLVEAAPYADGVEIAIRCIYYDRDALETLIAERGVTGRVTILDPVDVTEMVSGLHGFDVGILIRRPQTENDALPVPGKLFEYMMAGLATVAARLPGLEPIVEGEGVGLCYEPDDPATLGRALAALAADRDRLVAMRERARELSLERYQFAREVEALQRVWTR